MRPLLPAALAFALLACAPPPAAAADASAGPGLLAKLPDGRKLNFRCTGAGAPTVLLEGGYSADSLSWGRAKAALAKSYRVCSYDRAGAGFSDPGPMPRDGAAIARDLDRGLAAARIPGPYILVGHSAGGLYVRLFSNRRPQDVVGMVRPVGRAPGPPFRRDVRRGRDRGRTAAGARRPLPGRGGGQDPALRRPAARQVRAARPPQPEPGGGRRPPGRGAASVDLAHADFRD